MPEAVRMTALETPATGRPNGAPGAPSDSRGKGGHRVSWDIIRAGAIMMVVVQHATWGGPFHLPELGTRPFELELQSGANTLMVVSGFFVCQTLSSGGSMVLLRNRLVRMLPAFAVAAVVTHLVVTLAGPESFRRSLVELIATILVLPPNLVEGLNRTDGSYWTVPLQVTMFLVAAALWRTRLGRGRSLRIALWAVVAVPLVVRELGLLDLLPDDVARIVTGLGWYRAHLFAAGAAVWLWATRREGPSILLVAAGSVLAQFFYLGPLSEKMLSSTVAFGITVTLIVWASVAPNWDHPVVRTLMRPVVWLSGISYGIYLMNHNIGYTIMWQLAARGVDPMTQAAVMIVSSILLGWLLTVLVERPIARRFRARRRPPRSPSSPTSGGPGVGTGSHATPTTEQREPAYSA